MYTILYVGQDDDVVKAFDVLHTNTQVEAVEYFKKCNEPGTIVQVIEKVWL